MRKQADEESVVNERFCGLDLAVVDVHNVSNFLERVKRNTRREEDAPDAYGNLLQPEQRGEVRGGVHEEIEIFEHAEERKIQDEREIQEEAARSFVGGGSDFARNDVIHERRASHQKEEAPIPPAIKEVAGRKQHVVLLAEWQTPVNQDYENQKQDVSSGIKEHVRFVFGVLPLQLRRKRTIPEEAVIRVFYIR